METPTKIMVIGLDAPIAPRLYRFARDGDLPNLKRLIENGVYAENCLVPYPTITSSNWTTIATGAWPGTHGVTGYSVHIPGDPLDAIHDGFDSADNTSETLWEAAEREGRRSIIFDWPASWPPKISSGVVIGGGGVGINSWRVSHHNERAGVSIASYQLFTTEELPFATRIELREAESWRGLGDERCLQADLELSYDAPPQPSANRVEPKRWQLLVMDSDGRGFDRAVLSETKDVEKAFATLRPGEWSDTIVQGFETAQGEMEGAFRCKLLELSPDGRSISLYVTIINALRGWSYPESVAAEISFEEGLPSPRDGYLPLLLGWIDLDTFLEVAELQHIWTANAVSYLLKNKEWDLFFMHAHCPDWMYHTFSTEIEPLTNPDPERRARYEEAELSLYRSLDLMIGRILSCGGESPLVFVVSDHGAKASTKAFRVSRILVDAGLTVLTNEKVTPELPSFGHTSEGFEVDWSRTKAYAQRACYIYVNLKGRDPHGIVDPEREYEDVRTRIIQELYDYTDPDTGLKPVSLALKREDARVLGLYGDRVGDIVYALNPQFGGEHGNFLPATEHGVGSMRGFLAISGPGIARNRVIERNVWLTDIAPTICHLADLPIPSQAEGSVIYQALQDPNLKLKELKNARENYRKVARAFSSTDAETHRHGT